MAIISEQENFLLKFRQESSDSSFKSLDISVYKQDEKFVIEMKHEKRGSSIKIEFESLVEIVNYVQKKALIKAPLESSFNINTVIENRNKIFESEDIQVGSADDLIRDISKSNDISFYNAQADVIFANAVDMNAIKES